MRMFGNVYLGKYLFLISLSLLLICCKSQQDHNGKVSIKDYRRANYKGETLNDIFGVGIERHITQAGKLIRIEFLDKDENSAYLKESSYPYFPHAYRYKYDQEGKLISKIAYDSVGNIIDVDAYTTPAITNYQYDDKGRVMQVTRLDKDGELIGIGDEGISISRYEYNEKDLMIRYRSFRKDVETIISNVRYTYNENDEVETQLYLDEKDAVKDKFVYVGFTDDKDPVTVENYDAEGKMIGRFRYEYENGNVVSKSVWYHEWQQEKIENSVLEFDVKGWSAQPVRPKAWEFENYGSGEFDITIDENGKVVDAVVNGRLKGSEKFRQEVFRYLRSTKLSKKGASAQRTGKFRISVVWKFTVGNQVNLK